MFAFLLFFKCSFSIDGDDSFLYVGRVCKRVFLIFPIFVSGFMSSVG